MTGSKRTALPNGEKALYERIRELIINARQSVSRGVDLIQVHTNFEIGRRIVEQEQKGKGRAEYGEEIIKALASRLTDEFGRGFSASNLAYMRTFFLLYQGRTVIFQTASGKLTRASKTQIRTDQARIFQSMTGKSFGNKILQTLSAKSSLNQKGQTPSDQLRNKGGMGSVMLFQIAQTVTGQLSPFEIIQISSGRL